MSEAAPQAARGGDIGTLLTASTPEALGDLVDGAPGAGQ
jgi:hypothetical protein